MKILIIIDETNFYHPKFFLDLYKKLKKRKYTVRVGLVTKINSKSSIEKYLLKNLSKLYIREILLLGLKKLFYMVGNRIFYNFNLFYSVKSVVKKFKINTFEIQYNINKKIYINKIKKYNPDLIISSCSLYFDTNILKIPIYGCINRHTSLLPSYAGILPVFHSISDKKKYSGVSIHTMTKNIDRGILLAQKKIPNIENNLTKIYKKAFTISSDLIINAIDNLLIKKRIVQQNYKKNYYSFPNNARWIKFRKNKGKFI